MRDPAGTTSSPLAAVEGINRILHSALAARSEEELGEACIDVALRLTGSEYGFIGEVEADERLREIAIATAGRDACRVRGVEGHRGRPLDFRLHGLYGRVLEEGRPLIANAPAEHPDSVGVPEGHPPLSAFLGVPLTEAGGTIGVIAVANRPGGYAEEQRRVLEAVAPTMVEAFRRARAEVALRNAEAAASDLVRYAPTAIYEFTFDPPRFLRVNDAMTRMTGYTRDELLSMNPMELVAEEDRGIFKARMAQAVAGEHPAERVEYRVRRKDGSEVVADLRSRFTRDERGRPVNGLVIGHDVTERRRAETALRESEERLRETTEALRTSLERQTRLAEDLEFERTRLRTILADMEEGVTWWGPSGELLYTNEAAARMLGFESAERARRSLEGLGDLTMRALDGVELPRDSWPTVRVARGETFRSWDLEVEVASTGARFVGSFSGSPMRTEDGDIVLGILTVHDTTDVQDARRTAERELATSRLLLEAAEALGTWTEIDRVASALADVLLRALPHRRVTVSAVAEDSSGIRLVGAAGERAVEPGTIVPWELVTPPLRVALAERRTLVVDYDALPDDQKGTSSRYAGRVALVVPVVRGGRTVGHIGIDDPGERSSFAEGEIRFAEAIASHAAAAFDSARLFEAEQRTARLNDALSRINETLMSTLSVEEMLDRAVVAASEAAGAEKGLLVRPDGEGWLVTQARGFPRSMRGTHLPRSSATALEHTALGREPLLIADVATDPRPNKEFAAEHGVGAYMLLPLVVHADLLGILQLAYVEPRAFQAEDATFARRLSTALSLALQNARLYEGEHRIASQLQEALLALPEEIGGVEFAHAYHSATDTARVGGDFYDLFELSHEHVGITVGDVAGKGLDAAVLTSLAKNTIRAHASERGKTPSHILGLTNELLYRETAEEAFVTLFFGILDCRDGRLTYANAGHTDAALVTEDGSVARLSVTGPLLGAFPDAGFDEAEAAVGLDEVLFLYTDGLTEARSDVGEFFGEDRLLRFLSTTRDGTAGHVVEEVLGEVLTFTGGRLSDDLALLAVRRSEDGTASPRQQKLEL